MNFYDRYMNGEYLAVYSDILNSGADAFTKDNIGDIEKVLTETFRRVSYNLDVIYRELVNINYLFKKDYKYNFERPLHKPLPDTESLLSVLKESVSDYGFIPLSLEYFYKIVGGVNFIWDYETSEDFLWEMSDPIQIASLDSAVSEVTDKFWKDDMDQYVNDPDFGCAFITLSPDDLLKDGVSGGQAYAIQITKQPSVDSAFMNESNNTTFINYLRICFDNCGFPGITRSDYSNDYKDFFNAVKPKLLKI